MLRALLSSRLIQGGLVFFLLCVGGSLLYRWHTLRTTEPELGPIPHPVVSPLEKRPKPKTAPIVFQNDGVTNTPNETTDTQKHETTEAETRDQTQTLDLADAFFPDDQATEAEDRAETVPVSPFGFGPYPEVPADYSLRTPVWLRNPNRVEGQAALPFEIMDRVLIKLWNQGHKNITGASFSPEAGKVYPHYANTAYVRHRDVILPDGTVHRRTRVVRGGPDISPFVKQIEKGKPPAHIKLREFDSAGIDPYTFLKED